MEKHTIPVKPCCHSPLLVFVWPSGGAPQRRLPSHRPPFWTRGAAGERRDRPGEAWSDHLRRRREEEAAELHHPPGDPQSNAQTDRLLLP